MFPGFSAADFDAYQPKKWKSNVFNRERLEVKQKLVALGRALEGAMVGPDGGPLAVEPSTEHPALWNHKQVEAQHLYFWRNEGARKELDAIIDRGKSIASMIDDPTPQRNHLFLTVSVVEQAVELALKLHPNARIDCDNLERKCEDHFEREKLIGLLRGLGEDFRVGVTPELVSVGDLGVEQLQAILGQLAKGSAPSLLPAPPRLFYVGRTIDRSAAIAAGAHLAEQVRAGLSALMPLYRFIAWSRDNDFVSIREALQKEKQQRRQKGLAKNDAIRIVRGMFAGKSGVIQEIDARGGLRVRIGKMAVKVDAEDVTKA